MFDSIVEPHRPLETTMTPGQAVRASAVISNLLPLARAAIFTIAAQPASALIETASR
jgi:hypothetical protein